MEILELPHERPSVTGKPFDFAGLSNVLFESADLLEESRASDDPQFKEAALELAIRSLYTASSAIDRYVASQRPAHAKVGALVSGPWASEPTGERAPEQ